MFYALRWQHRSTSAVSEHDSEAFGNGYVLEYITLKIGEPNSGFTTDSLYLNERAAHQQTQRFLTSPPRNRNRFRRLQCRPTMIRDDRRRAIERSFDVKAIAEGIVATWAHSHNP